MKRTGCGFFQLLYLLLGLLGSAALLWPAGLPWEGARAHALALHVGAFEGTDGRALSFLRLLWGAVAFALGWYAMEGLDRACCSSGTGKRDKWD